jgi:hypothetical protein
MGKISRKGFLREEYCAGFNLIRRSFLKGIGVFSAMAVLDGSALARIALAMGNGDYPQGIRQMKGDIRINGIPAAVGNIVKTGNTVTTGKDSEVIFVIQTSVYLLRDNTEIMLSEEPSGKEALKAIQMISGKMMHVFSGPLFKREKLNIITKTAVIGARGTGFYVESEQKRTYFCLCYGQADIASKTTSDRESYKTYYHEKPRYINESGAEKVIMEAPVKNHTDAELILIESMVGRKPPFFQEGSGSGYRY